MNRIIRIGTRESRLARWQADFVSDQLRFAGFQTEVLPIKSEGDIDLVTPLYEMGVQGVFTKTLDAALLNNRIDIAVHSLKDVPTAMPLGLMLAAVPEREDWHDVMVYKNASYDPDAYAGSVVATGSLRRKAQWLNRYPSHQVVNLRGNIQTRLEKLNTNDWNAAIFAGAGIKRIGLEVPVMQKIDWMLPAPAQGALGIVCRADDREAASACSILNDTDSAICTFAEREFLRALNAGCTMPVAALAQVVDSDIHFKGNILSVDGTQKAEVEFSAPAITYRNIGTLAATELLKKGGREIAEKFKDLK